MTNILQYFEKTVELYTNKNAIADKNQTISFYMLKNQAMQYAYLIKDVGQNKPIGVFINRDIHSAEFFLAVLYSHNYYVPIDPELPKEKIALIIDDSEIEVFLGNSDNEHILTDINFKGTFITENNLTENCYSDLSADSHEPIYMVYTSGSTGKPKGVIKSHGAVIDYIDTYVNTFDFSADDVIGNQTPLYFDAAAKDFYLMVKCGASIEIIPSELFSGTTDLVEYMNTRKITFCSWVPTAISLVAQLCPFSMIKPLYLKKMFFVGEVMPMKHLNKWRQYLPDVEYVNLYGQSELAGICCYYKVEKQFENDEVLPIGKPMSNCKVYLIDGDEIVSEHGRIGEIYIVSDALATEYHNDAIRTKEMFKKIDFGDGEERCFKTGDLAQYNEDGDLVFASRSDYQIKHMGRRIELGEIETVAGAMDEIARCCCLYNSQAKKIVLFCQVVQGISITGVQLRSKMREIITSYMLPNKVVVLDELPLNANGKIDRQKLKEML